MNHIFIETKDGGSQEFRLDGTFDLLVAVHILVGLTNIFATKFDISVEDFKSCIRFIEETESNILIDMKGEEDV